MRLPSFRVFSALTTFTLLTAAAGCAAPEESDESIGTVGEELSESAFAGDDWHMGPSFHVGEVLTDTVLQKNVRIVHPLYLGATPEKPISLHFEGSSPSGAQIALLSPLKNGKRTTLGSAGYGKPEKKTKFDARVTETGPYLLVVTTHKMAKADSVKLESWQVSGNENQVGAVVSPRAGALASRKVAVQLNPSIPDDVTVELWAEPPRSLAKSERKKVGTVKSVGRKATFDVPKSVVDGDDLLVVVPFLESGLRLRLWTKNTAGVRIDRLMTSDFSNVLSFTGVFPFFEGEADLDLRSEKRKDKAGNPILLGTKHIVRERPGQEGMGFAMFDEDIYLPLEIAPGKFNPNIPKDGEILSVGFGAFGEEGGYRRVACFEFCNDLSGESKCTQRSVPCPK